jgi:Uma2 family endonuclease
LRLANGRCFYYPDVSGSCDPQDRDQRFVSAPCFIVEVLSPSTARVDRSEKRMRYLQVDSLLQYVMLEQKRMRAEIYSREDEGWNFQILQEPHHVVELSCLKLRLTLEQIYAGVDLSLSVAEPEVAYLIA